MAYIADNYDDVLAITQTDVFAEWVDELATQHNIRVINFNWFDGARHFLTNTPIHTPADLAGIRIRTPGAPVWATSVESMGATPVAMPWGETYNAIQTGVVDGAEAQHTASYAASFYEVVRYINKTYHFQLVNGIIVGEGWFNTLPEDLQVILIEEAVKAAAENARLVESLGAEIEASMVDNGMIIIEPDIQAFRQAAEAAYEALGFTELRARILAEIGR
jgi:TRAP-type C4-dicarboxylate transport system substrate-binding protein